MIGRKIGQFWRILLAFHYYNPHLTGEGSILGVTSASKYVYQNLSSEWGNGPLGKLWTQWMHFKLDCSQARLNTCSLYLPLDPVCPPMCSILTGGHFWSLGICINSAVPNSPQNIWALPFFLLYSYLSKWP